MTLQESEWKKLTQQILERELVDLKEIFLAHFGYNTSLLALELSELKASKVGRYSPSKFKLTLKKNQTTKVEVELIDLYDDQQHSFIDFLAYRDGFMWPIGGVLKLEKFHLAKDLLDFEVVALTNLSASLVMSLAECIVVEEQKMLRQSVVVQQIWKDRYMFRSEKEIEYQGVRYWRIDHPASMMH